MRYTSVAILGLGAVGAYAYWGLSTRDDIDLCVIASGERKSRLESEGIIINGRQYMPVVKTPEEARGADLLIVCLKCNVLPDCLGDIRTIAAGATAKTDVMSLMNGIDSESIIGDIVGMDHIIPAFIKVASERVCNNVTFEPESTVGIIYGEYDGTTSERMCAVDELFRDTGLRYRCSGEIVTEIWTKFRHNVMMNLPQAMLNVGIAATQDSEHVAFMKEKLRLEVEAVAAAQGIRLIDVNAPASKGSAVAKNAMFSTLQDLSAGRHTEIESFSGTVVKLGRELGVPTPYNEFTYHMIKALEQKNDGLFDYE